MRSILLLLTALLIGVTTVEAQTAGEVRDSRDGTEPAKKAEVPPEQPLFRAPTRRIVVVDSRDMGPELAATSTVMHGEEMKEIVKISEHKGDSLQLLLWNPPWDGPVLFHPGIAVPLESKAAKERRQKEAAEQKVAADKAAQTTENP